MEHYRVLRRLGEGAFGEVSLCKDLRTGREVAVKKVSVRRLEEGLTISVWREVKALELGIRFGHRHRHGEHARIAG